MTMFYQRYLGFWSTFPTAVYVIVGSGDDLKRVRARIVNEGLSNHVILADDIADDDLPHVYTACDVFLYAVS